MSGTIFKVTITANYVQPNSLPPRQVFEPFWGDSANDMIMPPKRPAAHSRGIASASRRSAARHSCV